MSSQASIFTPWRANNWNGDLNIISIDTPSHQSLNVYFIKLNNLVKDGFFTDLIDFRELAERSLQLRQTL